MTSRTSSASSCSGLRTGIAAIVVQLGLATIRFGADATSSPLTSLTTRGTSGSIRQADELSMPTAPAAANFGASSLDADAPTENNATSMTDGSAVSASSTTTSRSRQRSVVPADRADAK